MPGWIITIGYLMLLFGAVFVAIAAYAVVAHLWMLEQEGNKRATVIAQFIAVPCWFVLISIGIAGVYYEMHALSRHSPEIYWTGLVAAGLVFSRWWVRGIKERNRLPAQKNYDND